MLKKAFRLGAADRKIPAGPGHENQARIIWRGKTLALTKSARETSLAAPARKNGQDKSTRQSQKSGRGQKKFHTFVRI